MKRALLIALVLVGCKKKKADESPAPPPPSSKPAPVPVAKLPEPPPIPAAEAGPAYLSVREAGTMTLSGASWKVVAHPGDKWVDSTTISLGVDGTVWAFDTSRLWKLAGDDFVEQPVHARIEGLAGAADGSLWWYAEGKLHHLAGGKDAPIKLPTTDPPHGVARDLEGVWLATLDRTYRGNGDTWTAYDVPGVTGAQVDILQIDSNGRDAYLLTTNGVQAFDGTAWHPISHTKVDLGNWPSLVAGPAGRFAINTSDKVYAGDDARGLRVVGSRSDGTATAIDTRGRIWLVNESVVRVVDDNLKELKKWTPGDTPQLSRYAVWLQVGAGGPAQLDQSERAAGTVTGKVEGSAAGLAVRVCQQEQPEYNKEPCDGVPGTREGKTTAGGAFSIAGVPVGPQFFYVQRGGRWRGTTPANACCADLAPEGTFDAGTLALK